jgi:hypothetical protein
MHDKPSSNEFRENRPLARSLASASSLENSENCFD